MKRSIFALFCVSVFIVNLSAQVTSLEFGKISKEDFDYNACPQDKSAEAVVFYDLGNSYFSRADDGFDVVYERATRIKILRDGGLKWSNVEIPYYREGNIFEEVYDIKAFTYNIENGMIVKTPLDLSNCQVEKVNEYWNLKKFAMPAVKEGSVIEYQYKIRSQRIFNLRDWEFQWKIPVIYSKYNVKMIPFYQYTWILQGANKFDSHTSKVDEGIEQQFGPVKYKDMIHEFVMKNLPAFNDEEFITTKNDYIIKLEFQLSKVTQTSGFSKDIMTTWPALVKDLLDEDDFGGYISKTQKMTSKIFDLKGFTEVTDSRKLDSVVNFVKNNYRWDNIYGKFASKSPRNFINDKFGNDADLNLFAIGLLKGLGINAFPIIISTRDHGKIKTDYPFSSSFNYVLIAAEIDGKIVISDATERLITSDKIPVNCKNGIGLMVQKDKVNWVNIQSIHPSTISRQISIRLTDSTQIAKVEVNATDYDALDYRQEFGINIQDIKKHLLEKSYNPADSAISVDDNATKDKKYILHFQTVNDPEKINGKIYISPFLNEVISENPLKQQTRTYPIDLIYPVKRNYFVEIEIPKGYKVDYLPESLKINNDQFQLFYSVGTDETGKILLSFNFYFKKPVYEADQYTKIKYYFNEVVNKGSEKIVLVKE